MPAGAKTTSAGIESQGRVGPRHTGAHQDTRQYAVDYPDPELRHQLTLSWLRLVLVWVPEEGRAAIEDEETPVEDTMRPTVLHTLEEVWGVVVSFWKCKGVRIC